MTFQKHSLGSFREPKEVPRTNYCYFRSLSSTVAAKERIHKNYYRMLKDSGLI